MYTPVDVVKVQLQDETVTGLLKEIHLQGGNQTTMLIPSLAVL